MSTVQCTLGLPLKRFRVRCHLLLRRSARPAENHHLDHLGSSGINLLYSRISSTWSHQLPRHQHPIYSIHNNQIIWTNVIALHQPTKQTQAMHFQSQPLHTHCQCPAIIPILILRSHETPPSSRTAEPHGSTTLTKNTCNPATAHGPSETIEPPGRFRIGC